MILPAYLYEIQHAIEQHAHDFGLDFYEQVFEILDYKTMNEVAAYGGFPTRYPHWRFGMEYEKLSKSYTYGLSKIYEMVINNDPCYAYLLEGNSLVDQKLVISHVCAHNDFFKNNYYFSTTSRKMMDEMANHATRIRRYLERHGRQRVESFVDVCLSMDNLIDPMGMYIQRQPASGEARPNDEALRGRSREFRLKAKGYMERYINPAKGDDDPDERPERQTRDLKMPKIPPEPVADVMGFLIYHAPLDDWQRDVMEIIRKEALYFAPQGMTKIMNEGWATYWHSRIMTEKVLNDAEVIDYADHAAAVLGGGPSLNPYKIGVELFRYIADRWDRGRFGKAYHECDDLAEKEAWDTGAGLGQQKIFEVRKLYNDVMFIDEFFTEEFCREQLFYAYGWNRRTRQWEIQTREYEKIKGQLLTMLTNMGNPYIEVVDANFENRSELLLRHRHEGVDLQLDWAQDTLANLYRVWRRPVHILTMAGAKGKLVSFDGTDHDQTDADYGQD